MKEPLIIWIMDNEKMELENDYSYISIRAWKGVAARIEGKLEESRDLFQSCMGRFPSRLAVARLYRELALVEHLLGNKELAHFYDEKGLDFFIQCDYQPPSHNCYQVIDKMKKEGKW